MALKKTNYVRSDTLFTENSHALTEGKLSAAQKENLGNLTLVIAELLDAIGKGEVTHVTIGTPQNRASFLLTVNNPNGTKQYVGFGDVFEFGQVARQELLD